MAEAQMISLAEAMGREHAHDLVYEAAIRARTTGRTLAEVLPEVADEKGKRDMLPNALVAADAHVGEAGRIAGAAVRGWSAAPALSLVDTPLPELASRAL
jgi:3-carboxy-cis,cis-muconate cycloisomerase